jgi:hypothetical protein
MRPSSFMSGAREDVVKRVAEQMNDGIELVLADWHLGGKIAFHEQPRLLVKRLQSGGNVGPNWSRRPRVCLPQALVRR